MISPTTSLLATAGAATSKSHGYPLHGTGAASLLAPDMQKPYLRYVPLGARCLARSRDTSDALP